MIRGAQLASPALHLACRQPPTHGDKFGQIVPLDRLIAAALLRQYVERGSRSTDMPRATY